MNRRTFAVMAGVCLLSALFGVGWWAGRHWRNARQAEFSLQPTAPHIDGEISVRVTAQARANLGVRAKRLEPTTYWRKIEVPGILIDRPGVSDRGVTAPVTGVVTKIHSHPGETVEPSAPLFTLRLTSESLHASQREIFRASQEIEIAKKERERLAELAESGALAGKRLIEIDNNVQRLSANVQAFRQELLARGLSDAQINAAAEGQFLTEIIVRAPGEEALENPEAAAEVSEEETADQPKFQFEFHDLEVALGQQAEAGQVLCRLGDHRSLLVEGRGFKEDMHLIQQAAKNGYPIEIEFEEMKTGTWPAPPKELYVHHLENTIDPETRTFSFHLVLQNQWQVWTREGHEALLWRFRPGDRVRLKVAVEKIENVFVVPRDAIVREGPEVYVFRQNGDLFDRRPVHVQAEDRTNVVIANDGSLRPGSYIAQGSAAALNRALKAQMANGQPSNVHVHADGTVHAAH
jgi:cobalt-zinc-cadmium efflux system membrane fusion protein